MEPEELKASWNTFDKRLAETEFVNLRMVKEMVAQKTKTAFDRLYGLSLYNCVVGLIIMGVVAPYVFLNSPVSTTSFIIVEVAMVIGYIPQVWKLILLSGINLECKRCNELSRQVLRYKQACHRESLWTITCVTMAMVLFYISELGYNPAAGYKLNTRIWLVVGLTLLTFALAFVVGAWQLRRHAQQMTEIERGLEELKEFEN